MIQILNKSKCSGCYACANQCPKNCIQMLSDDEGFWYPKVNKNSCIKCGLCEKVCPIINPLLKIDNLIEAYACYNKNETIRMESSSGGVFTLIAENIIRENGIVFGAGFDAEFNVCHQMAETLEELKKFRMSKYVQSRIGESYRKAKVFLEQGRLVLFTGTPCQIGGLKATLGKEYSKLVTQDIICHGVPSPKVWAHYVDFCEKNSGSVARKIAFRQKDFGWKRFSLLISFENNTDYRQDLTQDPYLKGFLNNLYLRPSCHYCAFKNVAELSDITLADFWGVENVLPELFDDKGTSLFLIKSGKGKKIFEKILPDLVYQKVDLDAAIAYNPLAVRSALLPVTKRQNFFDRFTKEGFDGIVNELTIPSLKIKIKVAMSKVLDKWGIKMHLKKLLKNKQ